MQLILISLVILIMYKEIPEWTGAFCNKNNFSLLITRNIYNVASSDL